MCPGVPLFDAEATLLSTDRSLPASQLASILPYNFHLTGRLDIRAGRDYLQQLLSEPSRHICFLLLTPPLNPDGNNNNNSSAEEEGIRQINRMLEEAGKYGVGVGSVQTIKDIYFLTVPEAESLSMLSISPFVQVEGAALVLVIVPQRHLSTIC